MGQMMNATEEVLYRDQVIAKDRPMIQQIVESTGFFSAAEADVAVELLDERLAKGEASGYFFVFAECEGLTVGYACYGPIACTVGSYDLYWIAVDREHQGCGLGRQLLERVEHRVRERSGRQIFIETSNRPQYEPTRQFYLSCGYEVVSILNDFYERGDDKVTLRKYV